MNAQTKSIVAIVGVIAAVAIVVASYMKFMGGPPKITPEEGLKKRAEMEASIKAGAKQMLQSKARRPGGMPPFMKGKR